MKKLLTLFLAAFFAVTFSTHAFAAGINSAEQSVLANMRTPANMNGTSVYVPDSYINQAEARFNTIDMTEAQASEINSNISAGRAFIEGTGKSSIKELSTEEKQTLLSYASAAAAVLDLVTPAGVNGDRVKIVTKDVTVVMDETENVIKVTGSADITPTVIAVSVIAFLLTVSAGVLIILKKRRICYEEIEQ